MISTSNQNTFSSHYGKEHLDFGLGNFGWCIHYSHGKQDDCFGNDISIAGENVIEGLDNKQDTVELCQESCAAAEGNNGF